MRATAQRPVVIITGAGSGIGRATATLLARQEFDLVLVGRRRGALEDTATGCRDAGATVCLVDGDVAERATADRAVDSAQALGHLEALVNNAGIARFGPIEDLAPPDLEAMLDVHVRGPLHLVQAALELLRRHEGSVVNVTSVAGVIASPGRAAYGMTKAALNHLTKSLAAELAPAVRVNAIVPGPVDTPIYGTLGMDATELARFQGELVQRTPIGRFGRPEEIASWVGVLLGEQGRWVTGALLTVDGGRCALA